MLEDKLEKVARIFCGDEEGLYSYKSGPKLVDFFNNNFNFDSSYGQGFPSRWFFTYNKIIDLLNSGELDDFFSKILDLKFIMNDMMCPKVDAKHIYDEVIAQFNVCLDAADYELIKLKDKHKLIKKSEDLVLISTGGFAEVYKKKSTGLAVKKLKDNLLSNHAYVSRFKREYEITQELSNVLGVIQVHEFDDMEFQYTMELADMNLHDYIKSNPSKEDRVETLCQILNTMSCVHEKDILHRDLSPGNILIKDKKTIIADFGLGKGLDNFYSHNTVDTSSLGNYAYCDPKQLDGLKNADKKSDVYSLGLLMNFILTGNRHNNHHFLKSVSEKATTIDSLRYDDATELNSVVTDIINHRAKDSDLNKIKLKLKEGKYSDSVRFLIYEMDPKEIFDMLYKHSKSHISFMKFMANNENDGLYIVESIKEHLDGLAYSWSSYTWENYDGIGYFACKIVESGNFSYPVLEIACKIIRIIAFDVRRFNIQRKVDQILERGVEPTLEEILIPKEQVI